MISLEAALHRPRPRECGHSCFTLLLLSVQRMPNEERADAAFDPPVQLTSTHVSSRISDYPFFHFALSSSSLRDNDPHIVL